MKTLQAVLGLVVVAAACFGSVGFAAEAAHSHDAPPATAATSGATPTTPSSEHKSAHHLAYPHPTFPASHAAWPGVMVLIVAGMFLAAVAIGIVVDLNLPDELPPSAHGHDDHGHGHGDHGHGDHGHGTPGGGGDAHGHGHH